MCQEENSCTPGRCRWAGNRPRPERIASAGLGKVHPAPRLFPQAGREARRTQALAPRPAGGRGQRQPARRCQRGGRRVGRCTVALTLPPLNSFFLRSSVNCLSSARPRRRPRAHARDDTSFASGGVSRVGPARAPRWRGRFGATSWRKDGRNMSCTRAAADGRPQAQNSAQKPSRWRPRGSNLCPGGGLSHEQQQTEIAS